MLLFLFLSSGSRLLGSASTTSILCGRGVNGVFVTLEVAHSVEGGITLVAQIGDICVGLLMTTQRSWSLVKIKCGAAN